LNLPALLLRVTLYVDEEAHLKEGGISITVNLQYATWFLNFSNLENKTTQK
jgi:hypothetical protein